jgi:hypothetical protein
MHQSDGKEAMNQRKRLKPSNHYIPSNFNFKICVGSSFGNRTAAW